MSVISSMTTDASPPSPNRFRIAFLVFATGTWLALLQFSYFFLLEVHYSSRAHIYFAALFCWMTGFLLGLNLPSGKRYEQLLVVASLSYYGALAALRFYAFSPIVLPIVAICIMTGGTLAGAFFPRQQSRFAECRWLFLHENNGFVIGLLLALVGAIFHGRLLLNAAPICGMLIWSVERSLRIATAHLPKR